MKPNSETGAKSTRSDSLPRHLLCISNTNTGRKQNRATLPIAPLSTLCLILGTSLAGSVVTNGPCTLPVISSSLSPLRLPAAFIVPVLSLSRTLHLFPVYFYYFSVYACMHTHAMVVVSSLLPHVDSRSQTQIIRLLQQMLFC